MVSKDSSLYSRCYFHLTRRVAFDATEECLDVCMYASMFVCVCMLVLEQVVTCCAIMMLMCMCTCVLQLHVVICMYIHTSYCCTVLMCMYTCIISFIWMYIHTSYCCNILICMYTCVVLFHVVYIHVVWVSVCSTYGLSRISSSSNFCGTNENLLLTHTCTHTHTPTPLTCWIYLETVVRHDGRLSGKDC